MAERKHKQVRFTILFSSENELNEVESAVGKLNKKNKNTDNWAELKRANFAKNSILKEARRINSGK